MEVALIDRGLRWDHAGEPGTEWDVLWAVLRTQPWDSPLAKAMRPDDWYWFDPLFPVQIQTRDLLRIIATKQPIPKGLPKERIPKMTLPPWAQDQDTQTITFDPVTEDDYFAHVERLNGRRR